MNTHQRLLILTVLASLPLAGHAETPSAGAFPAPAWAIAPQLAQAAPWMHEQWQNLAPQERERLREELRQREREDEARRERERRREESRTSQQERDGERSDKQGYGRGYEDRDRGRLGGFGDFGSGGGNRSR